MSTKLVNHVISNSLILTNCFNCCYVSAIGLNSNCKVGLSVSSFISCNVLLYMCFWKHTSVNWPYLIMHLVLEILPDINISINSFHLIFFMVSFQLPGVFCLNEMCSKPHWIWICFCLLPQNLYFPMQHFYAAIYSNGWQLWTLIYLLLLCLVFVSTALCCFCIHFLFLESIK